MFIVFNKEKIISYLISFGTVAFLFVMAFFVASKDTIQTSANEEEKIYNYQENNTLNSNILKNNIINNMENIIK